MRIRIDDPHDPRLDDIRNLNTERTDLVVAEGTLVVGRLLE